MELRLQNIFLDPDIYRIIGHAESLSDLLNRIVVLLMDSVIEAL